MSLVSKLMDGLRARRQEQEQAASQTYTELVQRLAADKLAKSDTPEVVSALLAAAGRTDEDLVADVAAVQAHHGRRQRARRALSLEQAAGDAGEAMSRAVAEEKAAMVRLREAKLAAGARVSEADAAAAHVRDELERVLALVPDALRGRFEEARRAWLEADGSLRAARAEAESRRNPIVTLNTVREDLPCDAEELARLEKAVTEARTAADAALAAVLAYDPAPSALRTARQAVLS